MRFLYLLKSLGYLLRILSAAMFAGCLVPLFFRDYFDVIPYLTASVSCLLCGFLFLLAARKVKNLDDIRKVESLSVVALIWIVYGIFCGIPFLFYGFSFLDAVFESISGLTTTGASVIVDYDAYPPSVFFWRAYLHWLGGIGIVVLFVGVLPQFSVAGRQLFFCRNDRPDRRKADAANPADRFDSFFGLRIADGGSDISSDCGRNAFFRCGLYCLFDYGNRRFCGLFRRTECLSFAFRCMDCHRFYVFRRLQSFACLPSFFRQKAAR